MRGRENRNAPTVRALMASLLLDTSISGQGRGVDYPQTLGIIHPCKLQAVQGPRLGLRQVGLQMLGKKAKQRKQILFPVLTHTGPSSKLQMSPESRGHHRSSTLTHSASQCLLKPHFQTRLAAARTSELFPTLVKSSSPPL